MTAPTRAGHYNPNDPFLVDQVPLRHVALMNAASGVRVRRRDVPVDKVLLILASILVPLGLALILVGWWGAAHTGKLFEQIDYLISGGMLGVALAAIGGFLYFGYWLSRQLDESRRFHEMNLRALQRITGQLAALDRHAEADRPTGQLPGVYMTTPQGTLLHRADCPVVQGREDLRPVSGGTPGFRYCAVCEPAAGFDEQ